MRLASGLLIVVALTLALGGCTKGGDNGENETFAVVNGKDIKGREVLDKIKNEMAELNRNMYELKRRATEEMVQQRILEEEAKRQGVPVEKLFAQFDSLKDKEVGKADIDNFLNQRHIDVKKLTKQEKDSIPQIVKMQRVYEARQRLMGELRSKANVKITLAKPEEKAINVAVGNIPPQGPTSAKVTIVEFSDFQCPFCARGRQRVDEIKAKYGDKVKIYFRNFPLESIHPNAFHSAEAAACALEQGKFWEYHNVLFDNQAKLDEPSLIGYAKKLGLDEKSFTECLKSGKKSADIRHDMEEAQKYGVNSTPSFFVDGYAVRGAVPIEAFSEIIDQQLAK